MPKFAIVFLFIAMTFLSWGVYGPVLHEGQYAMGSPAQPASLRPLICVGIAYFVIAVVVPIVFLKTKGEKGSWSFGGVAWSFAAGAAGAVGALGIVLAFKSRGSPVYVMPLVFGMAPVVSTFVTMYMSRTFKDASKIFFAGVIIVAVGAAGVLFFKPSAKHIEIVPDKNNPKGIAVVLTDTTTGKEIKRWPPKKEGETPPFAESEAALAKNYPDGYKFFLRKQPLSAGQMLMIALSIGLTALCWGSYGPVLHRGQAKMAGSRLRPFICVGLAYFVIAVIVPFMAIATEDAEWTAGGISWSLFAGAVGAIGALGIIMAFNFGGKPIIVMPLVFGGAPVVNTFTTVLSEGTIGQLSGAFGGSLALVIGGAVMVLIFAPKPGQKHSDDEDPSKDAESESGSDFKPSAASEPQSDEQPENEEAATDSKS